MDSHQQEASLRISNILSVAANKVKGSKIYFFISFLLFCTAYLVIKGSIHLAIDYFPNIPSLLIELICFIIIYLLFAGICYLGIDRAFDRPLTDRIFYAFNFNMTVKLIGIYLLQLLIMLPFLIAILYLNFPDSYDINFFKRILYIPMHILSFLADQLTQTYANIINNMSLSLQKTIFFLAISVFLYASIFYLFIRMIFGTAFILDQHVDPLQAISLSFKATKKKFLSISFLSLVSFICILICIIPFLMGNYIIQLSPLAEVPIIGIFYLIIYALEWAIFITISTILFIQVIPYVFIMYGLMYKNISATNKKL